MRSIERSPGKPGDFCARRAPGQVFDRTRGQGTSVILAETCQPGNSTPRFLSAKRSAVSSRREEIAILRWRVNTQGSADPCAIPGGLVLYCLTGRASSTVFCQHSLSGLQLQSGMQYVQRSDCRAANLQSFAAARHFCSAKILAGGTAVGMGSPPQSAEAPPAQRNFQRKFALRQVGSSKFVVPLTRERSKVRNHARLGKSLYRAAPGCQRDRGPFCFGKSPEEPLPRGSFGQLLRGGSTPRFFAQLRSVGSKPTRLAEHCQSTPGPRTTGPAKKPPAAGCSKKPVFPS